MAKQEKYPPLILLIDTTQREKTSVGLIGTDNVQVLAEEVRAQSLTELIERLLHSSKQSWDKISAVAVLTGPGSYTGTRMGVTVANTLGWLRKLPIYGLSEVSFEQACEKIKSHQLPRSNRRVKAWQ